MQCIIYSQSTEKKVLSLYIEILYYLFFELKEYFLIFSFFQDFFGRLKNGQVFLSIFDLPKKVSRISKKNKLISIIYKPYHLS